MKKIVVGAVASFVGGFLYEQGRKAGKKLDVDPSAVVTRTQRFVIQFADKLEDALGGKEA